MSFLQSPRLAWRPRSSAPLRSPAARSPAGRSAREQVKSGGAGSGGNRRRCSPAIKWFVLASAFGQVFDLVILDHDLGTWRNVCA
jgi:hypothetical protein